MLIWFKVMTNEEVKKLKKGDEVFVKVVFDCLANDGDAYVLFFWTNCRGERIRGNVAVTIDSVLLRSDLQQPAEKPKYDPCRPLKKGDRVKPRIVYGRKPVCGIDGVAVQINSEDLIVESNEGKRENGTVDIKFPCGTIGAIDPVYLELVTPVEELEPYTLEEEPAYIDDEECGILHIYYNYNGGRDKVRTFYENGPESWNATKAAAEAECARLNAEHRKEQSNG